MKIAMLTFFCGKMGAGKSTKSRELAQEKGAILLSEDDWLEALYPNAISSLEDYRKYSTQLKVPIEALVHSLLKSGVDVVMDFPANTLKQREWLKSLYEGGNAAHQLIFIDTPNEQCLKQIEKRRSELPQRAKTDTKEMFDLLLNHFVEPQDSEGFNITRLSQT